MRDDILQILVFQRPEVRFAPNGEDFPDCTSLPFLDRFVEVDEPIAQTGCERLTQRGLTAAHESDQKNQHNFRFTPGFPEYCIREDTLPLTQAVAQEPVGPNPGIA